MKEKHRQGALDRAIGAWHRGEITDAQFLSLTRRSWTAIAGSMFSKWRAHLPGGVCEDDLLQELIIHAWRAVRTYRPDAGSMPVAAFVTWHAKRGTLAWVHTQRQALRRRGSAPSRVPVAVEAQHLEAEELDHLWPDDTIACRETWYALPDWMRDTVVAIVVSDDRFDAALNASRAGSVQRAFGAGPSAAMHAVRAVQDVFAG